jgi:C_GCAxxG_C_C family probable redox protein
MSRIQETESFFKKGYSCSQAVLAAFGPKLGVDRATALGIASGFGGGMGRTGNACGAVSGALMAVGLRYGRPDASPAESRAKATEKAREFVERFESRHGSIECKTLLGVDLREPDGHAKAAAQDLFKTVCAPLVRDAAEILAEILEDA